MEPPHQVAACLHGILAILNANRTLDNLLDYSIARACQLPKTPAGAIYRLNRQTGVRTVQASRGLDAEDAALDLPSAWRVVGQRY